MAELSIVPDDTYATANVSAETSLLAALLTGHPAATEAFGLLTAADFSQPRNAAVWDACLQAHAGGERIDPATLPVPPRARPYVAELVTSDGEPLHAVRYAKLILDAAIRRRLSSSASKVRQLAETAADAATAAQDAIKAVEEAAAGAADEDTMASSTQLVMETIQDLESGEVHRVMSGWPDLDDKVGGFGSGQLVVIGARPGYGKSVVAGNLMTAACKAGIGVHFASLEMQRAELMRRLLANQCSVDLGHLMKNQLTEDDWQRVADHSGPISEWPFVIDDQPGQTIAQIRARSRASARRIPLGMVIVDYLQIMGHGVRTGAAPREQIIGDISQGLKELAKEMNIPVVALAQVNRGPMERKDPRPTMSDLRESGRIEADADIVLLLHRPDLHDKDFPGSELEVNVAKNRNGPNGATVNLGFFGYYSRATSIATTRRTA